MICAHLAPYCLSIALGLAVAGCRSADAVSEPRSSDHAPAVDARAQALLRELFPEVEGPLTRSAIARAVAIDPEIPVRAGVRAETVDAIDRGEYERAKRLLDVLVAEQHVARADELFARGDAREALAVLDRAVELAPDAARFRALRGAAAFRVGTEDGEPALVDSALADFLRAARQPPNGAAWLGASRAALALGKAELALEYAREGWRSTVAEHGSVARRAGDDGGVLAAAARALAQASLTAYTTARERASIARANAADAERIAAEEARVQECYDEARAALETLVGETPDDPWPWEQVAWLHESSGAPLEAQRVAWRGLRLAPRDEALHARLASATLAVGGAAALESTYTRFRARHADVALAEWHPALASFAAAIDRHAGGDDARALFASAESSFARCRALDPHYAQACLAYEVLCRAGRGWCAHRAGELEAAHQAFLSMEDLFTGGLTWQLQGKLASGIEGLDQVGRTYARRGGDPNSLESIEDIARAGKIYEFLHAYQPDVGAWANQAGFFHRDMAIALANKARVIADQGRLDEADRLLARAREGMERSLVAYVDAAGLAPDDVRVQNDAGAILTNYLQRDADVAERFLARAVAIGEQRAPELRRRAQAVDLDPTTRESLRNELEAVEIALGDAYQNLGVLYLSLRNDAQRARAWFAKSVEISPDPRVEVTGPGGYLERCERALAGAPLPESRWAARSTR